MIVTLSIPRANIKKAKLAEVPKTLTGTKPKKPNLAPLAAAIQRMKSI